MTEDKKWTPEFRGRLAGHYDEIKWLYAELYHNDLQAFDYFIHMLWSFYEVRKPALRKLDQVRLAKPDWYRNRGLLGMQIDPRAFAGDLKGLMGHLDYLGETGISFLHLTRLLAGPEGKIDEEYAVSDYRKIQPDLGSMEDLEDLAAACHHLNISLCLDLAMDHTSDDHPWARGAAAGDMDCRNRYYFYDDWSAPNEYEKTLPQAYPQTAPGSFTWCDEAGKVVMTTFYPWQWDLNYRNPTVFNDMVGNILYLCNKGIDIIHLSDLPYIWKEPGTNCRNLPQVHTLARIMRMALEIVCPGTLLLGRPGEAGGTDSYFGTPDKPECHLLYNEKMMAAVWHTLATKDVRLLRRQMEEDRLLPGAGSFLNFLRSHDEIRWDLDYDILARFGMEEGPHRKFLNDYLSGKIYGVDCRGEVCNDDPRLRDARLCGTTASLCGLEAALYENNEEKIHRAVKRLITLHAFLYSQTGIPLVYSGDEIGQLNDYSYHEDPLKRDKSSYLHRGKMNWIEAQNRENPDTLQGRIYRKLNQLRKIRAAHDAFDADADVWVLEPYNDHVLALGRYFKEEKLLALFNFSEEDQTAWISEEEGYTDLLTGRPGRARDVKISGNGFLWLCHRFDPE